MASSFAFAPSGPTVFVGATATQIGQNVRVSNSYRVRNLSTSVQYFTTGATSSVTSASPPSAGVPAVATIGMLPSSTETFTGLGDFMIASSATGFEVTPGDGI
ncbi:hypothetical protein [Paraburkholderia sp. HD33-4]|uniref:hypothetical protein n=1 Tax=Paraburkholderia sp. HD33-4 TaxID=2883242 RepID=UPI001F324230|nr:hypothetical protein [Paraburkholderia sp. HD33-4]